MQRILLIILGGGALLLCGCRTQLAIGQRGPVVEPVGRTQGEALTCADCRCLAWSCGTRRGWRYRRFQLELEGGPVWQTRNDAAIPGDTGTRFGLDDLTGSGPFPYGRIIADYQVAPRHGVRLMLAPLEINGTGTLDQDVSFDGKDFVAGERTKGTYRFSSYRLTYRYLLGCGCDWSFYVGATGKIRDAKIKLEQDGVSATNSNLGFVPLLHLAFEKRLADKWRFVTDLDGAAAPQGRAFDFSAKVYYDFDDRFSVGLGYRTIEGGADNDSVYTFAWFHQAVVSFAYRF